MEGYDHRTYGDSFADVYDDWYAEVTDAEACARAVVDLLETGPTDPTTAAAGSVDTTPIVVELGVGTGRIARHLVAAGLDVRGIDGSAAMLDRLTATVGDAVAVQCGDFAELEIPHRPAETDPPRIDVVLCTYNTFFGLTDADAQQRCMRRIAEVLAVGGRLVVEAFVPPRPDELDDRAASDDSLVRVHHLTTESVVLTAAVRDLGRQTMSGHFVELRESGIRLRPWHLRYLYPEQLDALAGDAGLVLEHRWSAWDRSPATDDSTTLIHVYRLP